MGSVPPTTHANVSTIYLLKNPIKKPTSESDDSKLLIVIDHKKLEIGEFFLEKYLSGDLKKLLAAIKKWDSYLKKFRKSKQLFNSSELPLPVQFSNQESCSPSNSFNSSLTFDSTLVQLFYKNNKLRFIYKINHSPGPPMKYRFICWKTLLNIPNGFSDFGYEKFKRQKLSAEVERDIRKDLHRSYPTQKLFTYREKETNELTLGEKQLYNVLKAISNNYPRIGYCQGMNFIVGYLLLISGGNEHEAFSLFQKMGIDLRFII